ncbi:MAG: hypothetical protein ABFC31_09850 [Clostridiaceae bacterium]
MQVIILTKSSKHKDYCVAGIDTSNGNLVRLVSNNAATAGAVPYRLLICQNGHVCEPLDVVDVPIIKRIPLRYQPENVQLDESTRWKHLASINLEEALQYHPADLNDLLFGTIYYNSPEFIIQQLGYSLTIVEVADLVVSQTQNAEGSKKTKVSFSYNGLLYSNLSVTDPLFYHAEDGFRVQSAVIVVSIANEPYNGSWYKYVSKIFIR